jgi:DNA-binding transcriptional ArsR family regulator
MEPAPNLTLTFTALADSTRRSLIHALAHGETLSASELCRRLRADSRSIARHLQILERGGLIERVGEEPAPRFRLCQKPLQAAVAWIARQDTLYMRALDDLDRRLSETADSERGWLARRNAAD